MKKLYFLKTFGHCGKLFNKPRQMHVCSFLFNLYTIHYGNEYIIYYICIYIQKSVKIVKYIVRTSTKTRTVRRWMYCIVELYSTVHSKTKQNNKCICNKFIKGIKYYRLLIIRETTSDVSGSEWKMWRFCLEAIYFRFISNSFHPNFTQK